MKNVFFAIFVESKHFRPQVCSQVQYKHADSASFKPNISSLGATGPEISQFFDF